MSKLTLKDIVAEPPCVVLRAGSHVMVRGSRRDCERVMNQAMPCDHTELFARVDTRETQETITEWADSTFGYKHPAEVAARMSVEVAELVAGLATVANTPVEEIDPDTLEALRLEVADVNVMLSQVAEKLHVDIAAVTDFKMGVNRGRNWERTASGQFQHTVEPATFLEPGSGLTMSIDRWYILADSGSAYTPEGFETPAAALDWAKAQGIDAIIPTFLGPEGGWEDSGAANIMFARELRDFWKANPLSEGEPS